MRKAKGTKTKRHLSTYHSASINHVVNVPVRMGTEIQAAGDTRERTAFLSAKPTVSGDVFIFHLKKKKKDSWVVLSTHDYHMCAPGVGPVSSKDQPVFYSQPLDLSQMFFLCQLLRMTLCVGVCTSVQEPDRV